MKNLLLITTAFSIYSSLNAQQKLISDCTINFSVKSSNAFKQAHIGFKTIYVKGKEIRIDLLSSNFNQTTFLNNNTGNVTVLKEVGQAKYISHYMANEWKKENAVYDNVSVSFTSNRKKVLDYDCNEALLKLKNGITYTVYYTPVLILSSIENENEFKDVPGLVLEYESAGDANNKVVYTAEKIDFNPVPSLLFKIPKTGYRILH